MALCRRQLVAGIAFAVLVAAAAGSSALAGPATDYKLHCQGCHLPDGRGMADRVPSMKGEIARFFCVDGGRDYLIQVPGVAMSRLPDAEIAELMNWLVRTMDGDHLPTDFEPYTPDEVAQLRKQRETDVRNRRAELMARIRRNCSD